MEREAARSCRPAGAGAKAEPEETRAAKAEMARTREDGIVLEVATESRLFLFSGLWTPLVCWPHRNPGK